ncbi:hypothetical protein L596_030205 [Steinernema carpocapsae]|uniref:Uncharacterized protein n=1 Tax=Steinernema carpocapsae TaxID=34508 RepID=A0A4U5LS10_STECR|nr:hypothetical protein L596_030205 [Steinernema carpocapsae]
MFSPILLHASLSLVPHSAYTHPLGLSHNDEIEIDAAISLRESCAISATTFQAQSNLDACLCDSLKRVPKSYPTDGNLQETAECATGLCGCVYGVDHAHNSSINGCFLRQTDLV